MTPAVLAGGHRTTLTVGTFDGLHLGHQQVLAEIASRARRAGRTSALVTFEPHPLQVIAPERAPGLLTTRAERRLLWPLFGLDAVVVLPFTAALRELSAEAFVRQILVAQLDVAELVMGSDHGFGRDRRGDAGMLRALGAALGFDVTVVAPVLDDGAGVSSTRIREAVSRADLHTAGRALGRPYAVLGEVVPGAGRGRAIGFPTANVRVDDPSKCLPPIGVYAVRAEVDGVLHDGMAHFGPRPTFGEPDRALEVHLFEWPDEPLYGVALRVELISRLRATRRFKDAEDLARQLGEDRSATRAALSGGALPAALTTGHSGHS
ncbi:MAG: riboflavin biosynthesis protein RibF [Gemmatimonadota bacterium]